MIEIAMVEEAAYKALKMGARYAHIQGAIERAAVRLAEDKGYQRTARENGISRGSLVRFRKRIPAENRKASLSRGFVLDSAT
jgi:hypothetical protein